MPASVVPDVERALLDYLRGHAAVSALTGNVATEIHDPYPMLRVVRTGGTYDGRRVDVASLQVEVWGAPNIESRPALNDLMRAAIRALSDLHGQTVDGVYVSAVTHLTTLQWLPDPQAAQQRYLSTVLITAHS